MYKIDRPTKQQVRDWLLRRRFAPEPPQTMEQIRRVLGWRLVEKRLMR